MASSKNFEELISCGICFEPFNETDRRPRILTCGHSFCHKCLEKILGQSSCSYCPHCKTDIQSTETETIPVNFTLENLITTISKKSKSAAEGFCGEHNLYQKLRCMDCDLCVCNICAIAQHEHCKTLLVKDYNELKKQVSEKLEKELINRKVKNERIIESLKLLEEEKKELTEEIKKKECELKKREKLIEELENLKDSESVLCEKLKKLQNLIVSSTTNDTEFSKAIIELENLLEQGRKQIAQLELEASQIPLTLESLKELCSNEAVYAFEDKMDDLYGRVTVKDDRVWIHCFEPSKPEARIIPFKDLLSQISGSSDLPKEGFLEVTPVKGGDALDILLKAENLTPRSKNFLLLCSGIRGTKFKGRALNFDSASGYELHPGPRPVVKGIKYRDSKTPKVKGLIYGMNSRDSWFDISLKDNSKVQHHKIGVVVSGLQKLKDLNKKGKNLSIIDCGLVI